MTGTRDAIREQVAELGATFWLDADARLHAKTTRGPLPAHLVEKIKAARAALTIDELLRASYAWRDRAWTPVEVEQLLAARGAEDLITRRCAHLEAALAAADRGDVDAGRRAITSLRTAWRAAARWSDLPDRLPPDDFPNDPPKETR